MSQLVFWTLRRKLIAIVMTISALAVALASGATILYDAHRMRDVVHGDLSSLADIAGANSVAAMTFGDVTASREILGALGLKRGLVAAALYDRSGKLFASFGATARQTNGFPAWQTLR